MPAYLTSLEFGRGTFFLGGDDPVTAAQKTLDNAAAASARAAKALSEAQDKVRNTEAKYNERRREYGEMDKRFSAAKGLERIRLKDRLNELRSSMNKWENELNLARLAKAQAEAEVARTVSLRESARRTLDAVKAAAPKPPTPVPVKGRGKLKFTVESGVSGQTAKNVSWMIWSDAARSNLVASGFEPSGVVRPPMALEVGKYYAMMSAPGHKPIYFEFDMSAMRPSGLSGFPVRRGGMVMRGLSSYLSSASLGSMAQADEPEYATTVRMEPEAAPAPVAPPPQPVAPPPGPPPPPAPAPVILPIPVQVEPSLVPETLTQFGPAPVLQTMPLPIAAPKAVAPAPTPVLMPKDVAPAPSPAADVSLPEWVVPVVIAAAFVLLSTRKT
jgi:hypothetical protein